MNRSAISLLGGISIILAGMLCWMNAPLHRNTLSYIKTGPGWKPPASTLHLPEQLAEKKLAQWILHKHRLPVMVLNVNEADFFSYSNGIYVPGAGSIETTKKYYINPWWEQPGNYQQRGSDWQRTATCSYFSPGSDSVIRFSNLEIAIHGNKTRAFAQKSLRLKNTGKKKYFEMADHFPAKEIILRNGGNDWGRSLITDVVVHSVCSDMSPIQMKYTPVVAYLNDEYWGIHFLTNAISEKNLGLKYGVKKKNIQLFEIGNTNDRAIEEQFNKDIRSISNAASESMAWDRATDLIDINEFIDYYAIQIFFANVDWPDNNIKCFKTRTGKWHAIAYDLDCSFGYYGAEESIRSDMFQRIKLSYSSMATLFNKLMGVKKFREQLKNRLAQLLNEKWSSDKLISNIKRTEKYLSTEISRHCGRWRKPANPAAWKKNLEVLYQFAQQRQAVITQQMNDYLGQ